MELQPGNLAIVVQTPVTRRSVLGSHYIVEARLRQTLAAAGRPDLDGSISDAAFEAVAATLIEWGISTAEQPETGPYDEQLAALLAIRALERIAESDGKEPPHV